MTYHRAPPAHRLTPEQQDFCLYWRGYALRQARLLVSAMPSLHHHREDVMGVALVALAEAARTCDPSKNADATWVRWWVRSRVIRYARRDARAVVLPASEVWRPAQDASLDAPVRVDGELGRLTLADTLTGEAEDVAAAIDGPRLMAQVQAEVRRRLIAARPVSSVRPTPGQRARASRNARVFVLNAFHERTMESLRGKTGLTRAAVGHAVMAGARVFQDWAAEVRGEAEAPRRAA